MGSPLCGLIMGVTHTFPHAEVASQRVKLWEDQFSCLPLSARYPCNMLGK